MKKTSRSRLPAITMETRSVKLDRSAIASDSRAFTGHAAVYNQRTAIGNPLQWGFYEEVAPGAFDKSLRDGDVVMLADHDPAKPIARTSAGTLDLVSDGTGLAVDVPAIPNLTYGDDLIENVRVGNVAGMSFGFQVVQDAWTTETVETNDGQSAEVEVRTLQEVKLIEVSTTPFPAYTGTDAGLRAVRSARQSQQARMVPGATGGVRIGATHSAATVATLTAIGDELAELDQDDPHVVNAQDYLATLVTDDEEPTDDDGGDEGDGEENSGFPLDLAIRYRQLAERERLTA